jgi:hypothetical protein
LPGILELLAAIKAGISIGLASVSKKCGDGVKGAQLERHLITVQMQRKSANQSQIQRFSSQPAKDSGLILPMRLALKTHKRGLKR